MRKFVIAFGMMLCCVISHAQILSVIDQQTGEALPYVVVSSEEKQETETTNAKGQVDISAFAEAEDIKVRLLGYENTMLTYYELGEMSFVLRLQPSTLNMNEVVISASRWNDDASDVPSRISTISPKDAALFNPQTAADLLEASGEVFVQKSQQGGGSPMIRGFATNRLLYTIDGVRMNTAIFRGGNIQNVISLDPFAIENTEVFFGPGSVIYGSDAIGGVMSFSTLTPQLSLEEKPLITGNALSRYSSANNEITGHFDVNVGWKKWALLSSISYNRYGDLKMGSHGPEEYLRPFYVQRQDSTDVIVNNEDPRIQKPSGFTQMNLMQKIRFQPNKRWNIEYGFHYSETSDYARYDRHIRYKNDLPRYGEWSYGPQKWMMNNLSVTHHGHNVVYDHLSIRVAHQLFEESRISRDFNDPNRETRIEKVNALSANVDFEKKLGMKNTLRYGLEYVINDVNSTGINENIAKGTSQAGPTRYPQSQWASYAVYISDQYKISEKFILNGGVRYNHFTLDARFDTSFYNFPFTTASLSNGSLTGNLGMVYHPTEKWSLSLNGSTAFRSPNVDDVGKVFDSEPGSVVVPNPDLEAEYAYNVDFGVAKMFGNFLKIDVTGYYTYLQNALVRRDYTLNGQDSIVYDGTLSQVQAIQNAAVAQVYGVQAGIELKLKKGFGFSSDFNWQEGFEEQDDGSTSPSRHAAPWFGVTRISYKAHNLSLMLYAEYSGEKSFEDLPEGEKGKDYIYAIDANGNPYSPAWYTLNFKAMYKITNYLTVMGGVENITDQRYRPYSSGIVAPGRNFILSLKATF